MSVYPKQKTTELIGLACLMCALLLILALYSYSPLDGSLNVSSGGTEYLNYIGRTGAWLSDFLLQLFGLAALVIPFVLLSAGFRQLRGRSVEYPIVKTCGTLGMLAAAAAGLSILQPTLALATHYELGGIVGILVASVLEAAFNSAGALIVVCFVLLFTLVITTRFSFEAMVGWLSEQNWNPFASFRESYAGWQKRRQDRRTLKRLREDPRAVVNQPPPRKMSLQDWPRVKLERFRLHNLTSRQERPSAPHESKTESAGGGLSPVSRQCLSELLLRPVGFSGKRCLAQK